MFERSIITGADSTSKQLNDQFQRLQSHFETQAIVQSSEVETTPGTFEEVAGKQITQTQYNEGNPRFNVGCIQYFTVVDSAVDYSPDGSSGLFFLLSPDRWLRIQTS